MKNISAKKGFTLIELLIVIAIIGILAAALLVSLGGARAAARDARRISDLRNVQAALELYFNKTGAYPDLPTTNTTANWGSATLPCPATPGNLVEILLCAGVGISKVPNDPVSGNTYRYGSENSNQKYVLGATLENEKIMESGSTFSCSGANPTNCVCTAAGASGKNYCVGI